MPFGHRPYDDTAVDQDDDAVAEAMVRPKQPANVTQQGANFLLVDVLRLNHAHRQYNLEVAKQQIQGVPRPKA